MGRLIFVYFISFFLLGELVSCSISNKKAVTIYVDGKDSLFICDYKQIRKHEERKLSEYVDDFKIIFFENKDICFFRYWKVYVTDNYIGILQSLESPFKLFDHNGNFICDVGTIGKGPGEYLKLYSAIIDEYKECIYLAPFFGNNILKYNLDGTFQHEIYVGSMQKAQMALKEDGDLVITHLALNGLSKFQYAQVDKNLNVSYVSPSNSFMSSIDLKGNFVGFNHDIWFFNNTTDFTYMTTALDTLYLFDEKKKMTLPRFTMINHTNYCIYNECPSFFLIEELVKDSNMGNISKTIISEKENQETYYLDLKNDFLGDLPVSFNCRNVSDGWYHEMFEPYELLDKIDDFLESKDCTAEAKKLLKQLESKIDENGNNILFIAKLKDLHPIQ